MSAAHTPTPWRISGKTVIRTDTGHTPNDERIGSLDWRNRPANAAFICRAVNAHDDLVAALKYVRPLVFSTDSLATIVLIDAALAKAAQS